MRQEPKLSLKRGPRKGTPNQLRLSLRSVLDDLSMDTAAQSLLDIDQTEIERTDSLTAEFEQKVEVDETKLVEDSINDFLMDMEKQFDDIFQSLEGPSEKKPREMNQKRLIPSVESSPTPEGIDIDRKSADHYDHNIKLLNVLRNELLGMGLSPIDFEEVLVHEFTNSVMEDEENPMNGLDPEDTKAVRSYIKDLVKRIQKE